MTLLKKKFERQYNEVENIFRQFILKSKEGIRMNLPSLENLSEGYDFKKLCSYFPYLHPPDIYKEYIKNPVKFISRLENCSHDYQVITIKDDSLGEKHYYKEKRCKLCQHIKTI